VLTVKIIVAGLGQLAERITNFLTELVSENIEHSTSYLRVDSVVYCLGKLVGDSIITGMDTLVVIEHVFDHLKQLVFDSFMKSLFLLPISVKIDFVQFQSACF